VIEALADAVAWEVAERAIPSISFVVFDAAGRVDARHITGDGAPLADGTSFRIASISKSFTALTALRAVERGALDLDDDIAPLLGDFAPSWQGRPARLTLRLLLSHRSGLMREAARGHYLDPDPPPLAGTVDSLRHASLKAAPDGASYRYSNAGYALAGACIEAAVGVDWGAAVSEAVLEPLGLRHTRTRLGPAERARLAPALMWDGESEWPAPVFALGGAPAGAMLSTLGDMAAYGQALLRAEGLLSPALRAMMTTPAGGGDSGYGLGLAVDRLDGHRTLGHGGALYGYAAQFTLLPEAGIGLFMVATLDASGELVTRLTRYGLRLALAARGCGERPTPPRRLPRPDVTLAADLVGRYASESGVALDIRRRAGRLELIDRGVPLELRPLDGARFVLDGRLHGEATSRPDALLERVGRDVRWSGTLWRRDGAVAAVPPDLAPHLGRYGPAMLPTRLVASGDGLVCVLEGLFPQRCEPVGSGRYRLGPGLYEDEPLQLGATKDGRPALRVGAMLLERLEA
jgi:D-alanyl-D-alanine dipeptidase